MMLRSVTIGNSRCVEQYSSVYLQAWDDVERKARPIDKMSVYSKRTVLDQEKSKLSLSQIYEQQFLKQTQVCAVQSVMWSVICYMYMNDPTIRLHGFTLP